MLLRRNPDSLMTLLITLRVSTLTGPLWFMARETVATETPARCATSLIVGVRFKSDL